MRGYRNKGLVAALVLALGVVHAHADELAVSGDNGPVGRTVVPSDGGPPVERRTIVKPAVAATGEGGGAGHVAFDVLMIVASGYMAWRIIGPKLRGPDVDSNIEDWGGRLDLAALPAPAPKRASAETQFFRDATSIVPRGNRVISDQAPKRA